ncbi:diguanylate cyclase (GGDEF) domain-containing protein [Formivibrio citricus]|uniref:diguanylate cyclase n=2 Tax=Formivibrio citricus TaxID=83765 RepID=A0A1I4V1X8_9NEIS|nr:diguanylate cyclase (GGDEF) domain-containing protein [Formivibrio citricus]
MPARDEIKNRIHVLRTRWESYVADGTFDQFIEFTVAINSLAEHFNRMRLPGLVRICEGLEKAALTYLGTPASHPLGQQVIAALQRQVDTLAGAIANSQPKLQKRRADDAPRETPDAEWVKPRSVWLIVAPEMQSMADALTRQMGFFGFKTLALPWGGAKPDDDMPLAVIFIPAPDTTSAAEHAYIAKVRTRCAASQLIYLGAPSDIEAIVELMRAGLDVTLPQEEGASTVLSCVLDLVQNHEPDKYRVLVVEDSRVAATLIQRTLAEHNLDSQVVLDPRKLLEEVESYRPDLILMDMHMPRFNGVEATRVLRQMAAYKSLPIVYLSGEADIGMQVEALRLGGDQFLSKPFNPVLLTAVVKTKIERFREMQRSTRVDGLTGLMNHTAAKSLLKSMMERCEPTDSLTVAMIDIDHFKSINDTYGHPVGDQVIRSLAWLLKGRLRSTDLIGRYGGEEFLIALPGIAPQQALQVIDRIRNDFSILPHAHPSGTLFASFSAGVAAWPNFDTAASLTEAADHALLQAKRYGRNRVESSENLFTMYREKEPEVQQHH